MYSPLTLWLPILVSAILVFVVSSLIHMLSPWHKSDFPRLPNGHVVQAAHLTGGDASGTAGRG